jgi:hypothetical protein
VAVETPTFYPVELGAAKEVHYPRGAIWSGMVTVRKERFSEFAKLYQKYQEITHHPRLLFAIKRFNYGMSSISRDDKIVEYVIALESLFSNTQHEITDKLSLRIAVTHESNLEDVKDLKEFIAAVYDVRSTIVHGAYDALENKVKEIEKRWPDWIHRVEDVARKSIIAYVNLMAEAKKQFHEIIPVIDDAIIDASKRNEIRKIGGLI